MTAWFSLDGVQPLYVRLAQTPAELRALAQWVLWRYEERLGRDGKPYRTKVPYQASGQHADSTDPKTWTTFELALTESPRFDGVGYVFASDDPYTGCDFDHCFTDGRLHPDAAALIGLLGSYSEISPSGEGVKVIVRGSMNGFDRHSTADTPWGSKFECYDDARFFTLTGQHLRGTPTTIEPRQAQLDAVLARVFPPKPPRERPAASTRTTTPIALAVDDQELLRIAYAATNGPKIERLYRGDTGGYDSDSEATAALCWSLAFYCQDDPERLDRLIRGSGLMRPKWDERRGDSTWGAQEVARALAGQTEFFQWGRSALRPVSKRSVRSDGAPEVEPQYQSEEDAWDEPVPLNERGNVPAFPVFVLPGWMADWSTETAREKGASADLAATLALGVVSGALARHVQVSPRPGWYEPTNLYLATALEPGQRKTPIFKSALRPVRAVEYHRMQDWQNANGAVSLAGEILTKRRRDLVTEAAGDTDLTEEALRERMGQLVDGLGPTETGPRPRLLTEDITPEGLTTMLAEHGRVISASDEGAAFFENLGGRYARGSTSWDGFNKAHSAADLVVDRKGSGSAIVWDPALTLIVATQPNVLRELWGKPGTEGRGVLSRPLYAFPEPVYGTGRTPVASESVSSAFGAAIRALFEDVPLLTLDDDGKPQPVTLRFDPAAERSFERYEAEVAVERRDLGTSDRAEDETAYLGWLSKLAGQTARLAACLHAATHWTTGVTMNTTIGVECVENTIEVARYFHAHARAAFGLMGEIPEQRRALVILSWLRSCKDDELDALTVREVHRSRTKGTKVAEVRAALKLLEEHGYVRLGGVTSGGKPGRPSERVFVHPSLRVLSKSPDKTDRKGGSVSSVGPLPVVPFCREHPDAGVWLAHDGVWRCYKHDPPSLPGEVVEARSPPSDSDDFDKIAREVVD